MAPPRIGAFGNELLVVVEAAEEEEGTPTVSTPSCFLPFDDRRLEDGDCIVREDRLICGCSAAGSVVLEEDGGFGSVEEDVDALRKGDAGTLLVALRSNTDRAFPKDLFPTVVMVPLLLLWLGVVLISSSSFRSVFAFVCPRECLSVVKNWYGKSLWS